MAKASFKEQRTNSVMRFVGGAAAVGNGAYLGRVGTKLQVARDAVSGIKRQAERALNRDGK